MSKLFDDLKEAFEDVIAFEKGQKKLRTSVVKIPAPPARYSAKDIKRIRQKTRYSQSLFAKVLNVSVRTIQAWETGLRIPSQVAMRLLEIVDKGIYRPV